MRKWKRNQATTAWEGSKTLQLTAHKGHDPWQRGCQHQNEARGMARPPTAKEMPEQTKQQGRPLPLTTLAAMQQLLLWPSLQHMELKVMQIYGQDHAPHGQEHPQRAR